MNEKTESQRRDVTYLLVWNLGHLISNLVYFLPLHTSSSCVGHIPLTTFI